MASEPREWKFIILDDECQPNVDWYDGCFEPGRYHVIEKSAYDAVVKTRDEYRRQLEDGEWKTEAILREKIVALEAQVQGLVEALRTIASDDCSHLEDGHCVAVKALAAFKAQRGRE